MSKIAEQKALEAYPEDYAYVKCDNEDTNYTEIDDEGTKWLKIDSNKEFRAVYTKGYDQAMQDFMEKACIFLKNRTMAELCLDSELTELVDDFIEHFKDHMQNESEN